jgi:hypothetical protein
VVDSHRETSKILHGYFLFVEYHCSGHRAGIRGVVIVGEFLYSLSSDALIKKRRLSTGEVLFEAITGPNALSLAESQGILLSGYFFFSYAKYNASDGSRIALVQGIANHH